MSWTEIQLKKVEQLESGVKQLDNLKKHSQTNDVTHDIEIVKKAIIDESENEFVKELEASS